MYLFPGAAMNIARMAFDMFFVTGAIWKDIGWSSLEFALGVALAFAIGIGVSASSALAIWMASPRKIRAVAGQLHRLHG